MQTKNELIKQIAALEEQKKPLEKQLREIYDKEAEDVEVKIKRCHAGKDKFELDELRFAATSRCECGAGMAYPKNVGVRGSWDCSDILLGRAIHTGQEGAKIHSGELPFAFYEIKSEDQPSANGQTTRPNVDGGAK